jgi:hypothetical protein
MASPLYEFLNELSKPQVVQKTLDKEYNYMVSPLYGFLNELSDGQVVQKTFDEEYNLIGFSPVWLRMCSFK